MTSDKLKKVSRVLRWIGWMVTGVGLLTEWGVAAVGLVIAFISHIVADWSDSVQRTERALSKKRLEDAEAKLKGTRLQVTALESRLDYRILLDSQREEFSAFVANGPKGNVEIQASVASDDALAYATAIKEMLWAGTIQKGFEAIGISVPCSPAMPGDEIDDDTPILYVENKPKPPHKQERH